MTVTVTSTTPYRDAVRDPTTRTHPLKALCIVAHDAAHLHNVYTVHTFQTQPERQSERERQGVNR